MQRKTRYFSRDGEEVGAQQALRDGVLQSGYSVRVPTIFRDATPRHFRDGRALFDSGQVVITDGDGTLRTANSPGWRISDSPINRQAVHDARARYLSDLQRAYKNPLGRDAEVEEEDDDGRTECPDCEGSGYDENGKTCRRCQGTGEVDEPDDDADAEAERVADAVRRRRRPAKRGPDGESDDEDGDGRPPFGSQDRRTVDQIRARASASHGSHLPRPRPMAFRAMEDKMIERERRRIHDPEPSANGIDASSPLPDKLAELERRISAALTEPRTATDLADLIEQTDIAVVAAEDFAKTEHDTALDPTMSPEPHAARQRAEDAQFMVGRLRTLQPRLLARYQQVCQQAAVQEYLAKRNVLKLERDTLEQELTEVFTRAAGEIVALFQRVNQFKQRAQQQLGDPPANVEPLPALATAHLLDKVQLFDFDSGKQTWPPPSTFAADFATSMRFDSHPGQHWSDPEIQQRQRAERETERQHNAAYHEQAAREQEVRQNKELREQFSAQQRQ